MIALKTRRTFILGVLVANVAAHGLLLPFIPLWLRASAALIIGALAPGLLAQEWLVAGRDGSATWSERAVYALCTGYGIFVWTLLALSYLPGELSRPPTLIALNVITLTLAYLAWRTAGAAGQAPSMPSNGRRLWITFAIIILLAVGGYFRFANLGYSEFQGDEATPMVRAAAVVQGTENALFLHRRGPAEVLIPAGMLVLTGDIDEGSARLPYALANLAAVFTVFLLGRRMFGPLAGWSAAMLLALDGYFIGFGRVMHYESIIFLTAAVSVYLLYRLYRHVHAGNMPDTHVEQGYLTLAVFAAVLGAASHYDGIVVLVPAIYLLLSMWRDGFSLRRLALAGAVPALFGLALLLSFYIPFLLHPNFADTLGHYTRTLVDESGYFVNNLSLFAESVVLYNGALTFYLLVGLWLAALIDLFLRQRGWYRLFVLPALLVVPVAVVLPHVSPYMALILAAGAFFAPRMRREERLLWLWFFVPFIQAVFLTETPGIHFHVFFIPWMLICGRIVESLWLHLSGRVSGPIAAGVGLGLAILLLTAAGGYAQRFFVERSERIARALPNPEPPPLWARATYEHGHVYYGIPHNGGWKAIGALFDEGVLRGNYVTNVDEWIGTWYTRSAEYCDDRPDQVLIERLADQDDAAELFAEMGDEYRLWATVSNNGEPKLDIYRRSDGEDTLAFQAEAFAPYFDEELSGAPMPLAAPAVTPNLAPLDYRFGDNFRLTGYALNSHEAEVGKSLFVTLQWQLLAPTAEKYTLFLQVIGPENRMIGQRDTMPSCKTGPTSDWELGETPMSTLQLPIFAGEDAGTYPLSIGLYHNRTHDRLPIFDAGGQSVGDALQLTTVSVVEKEE